VSRGRYAKGVDWGGVQSGVPTVGHPACHSTLDWVKNAATRDTSVGVRARCAVCRLHLELHSPRRMCERHNTSVPLSPRGVTVPRGVKSLRRLAVWANRAMRTWLGATFSSRTDGARAGAGAGAKTENRGRGESGRIGRSPGQAGGVAERERGNLRPLAELNDFHKLLYDSG
jgi:hypothetical protein